MLTARERSFGDVLPDLTQLTPPGPSPRPYALAEAATFLAVLVALQMAAKDRRRAEDDRLDEARRAAVRQHAPDYDHSDRPIRHPQITSIVVVEETELYADSSVIRSPLRNVLAPGSYVDARLRFSGTIVRAARSMTRPTRSC